MLKVRGLAASYGASQVLFDISLDVARGEVVTLLGRNGMGKTTTIRAIMGLLGASAGSISVAGQDVCGWSADRIARLGIGLVPEGRQIFPTLNVRENLVATAANRAGVADPWTLDRVFALFPRLDERQEQAGRTLSGGEQQMLAIGRALRPTRVCSFWTRRPRGWRPWCAPRSGAASNSSRRRDNRSCSSTKTLRCWSASPTAIMSSKKAGQSGPVHAPISRATEPRCIAMSPSEPRIVFAEGHSSLADPAEAMREALSALMGALARAGAAPGEIVGITLTAPEPQGFHLSRRVIDNAWREVCGGLRRPLRYERGGEGLTLHAEAHVRPPIPALPVWRGMSAGEIARAYSPRQQADMQAVFRRWNHDGALARAGQSGVDLAYGPSQDERLDFVPATDPRAPLWVFLHGGTGRPARKISTGNSPRACCGTVLLSPIWIMG
ncbi:MAG: transporter ATP-binding protein [Hyphomicrobiales bacterium]|nr:transporter ATP-binding protein [Hyphomicrobiales bacterium]